MPRTARHVLLTAAACLALCRGTGLAGEPPPAGAPPARARPRFLGPRTGPERAAALAKEGGTAATEKAVAAGLDWLARHQEPDGRWDADGFPQRCAKGGPACTGIGKGQHGEAIPCPFDSAISALATLAFLGAGHGPWVAGDPYGDVVERALTHGRGAGDPWGAALWAQALAEAAVLEGGEARREAAQAAARRLLGVREKDGAWAYIGGWRPGSDVPLTALVVPALVAARDAGFPLPTDVAPEVERWLLSLEADEGRLAYLKDGRAYGYTPTTANGIAAAAIREQLEVGLDGKRHKSHLSLAARDRPDWVISFREIDVPGRGKLKVQVGHLSFYEWWYGTEATFQAGGDAWRGWFSRLSGALVPHQVAAGCAKGSWDPVGGYERATGGRVFATALGVLMLETPYRRRRLSETRP
jgi:hypothetical protein